VTMDIGERSKKFVEYHMFVTFAPVFETNTMVNGLWHEVAGQIRYEAVMAEENDGTQLSYLFPIFDPECSDYDDFMR
jgi:hypothetical protein